MESLPQEIYDRITLHVEANEGEWAKEINPERRHYKGHGRGSRVALGTLRLVNHAFCHSASRRLFRHLTVMSGGGETPVKNLMEIPRSPYAGHVCQIDFMIDPEVISSDDLWDIKDLWDLDNVDGILSWCAQRLPNIRALEFHYPRYRDEPEDDTGAFVKSVVAALRNIPFPNLEELDITFPLANDFADFFSEGSASQIPIESVLGKLKHLGLSLSTYTDIGVCKDPRCQPFFEVYNRTHANHMFNMIEHASRLESLSLSCTDMVDFDSVRLSSSVRLKSLYLTRVEVSSTVFLDILEQNKDAIEYIELREVVLTSGKWREMLLEMSNLPHLLGFNTVEGGYPTNSELAPTQLPDYWPYGIVSKCRLDIGALAMLHRQVNANRAAVGYEAVVNKTLEEYEICA